MPDTLCRRCGSELSAQSKCAECYQTIQYICPKCQYTPLEKFHLNCMLMSRGTYLSEKNVKEVLVA